MNRTRSLLEWMLPSLFLASILLFDLFFLPGATITPICSFLILAVLSFFLQPVPMLFWACAYGVSAIFTIYHPALFTPGPLDPEMMRRTRAIGASFAAAISVVLCYSRVRSSAKSQELNLLIKEMPVPFVLSNANGEILFISAQAEQMLEIPAGKAIGDSLFTVLSNTEQKGYVIQKYLEAFEAQVPKKSTIALTPRNNPTATLYGNLIPVHTTKGRCMITMISHTPA